MPRSPWARCVAFWVRLVSMKRFSAFVGGSEWLNGTYEAKWSILDGN